MAIKWTSVQNQNLLLLIVQNTKINYNTLPEKWTAKYPNETFQPTTRGISQHIDKLKKTPGHASAGTTWTAARDESLLLLLVQELKIDFASLPQKWAAKYPNEPFKPSERAISQHVNALKKKSGSASTATTTTSSSSATPSTPRGKGAVKKPASSRVKGKRARAEMEDEDKSEDEDSADQASPAKKRVTPRRSVTRKSYKEELSDEDEGNASAEEASDTEQDDYLTSAHATARTIDFGVPKADSAVSGMSSPSKRSEDHIPAGFGNEELGEEMFRPTGSIARSKNSAPRPYDLFDGLVEDDADASYMPLI